jgi:hypothetical protein
MLEGHNAMRYIFTPVLLFYLKENSCSLCFSFLEYYVQQTNEEKK